MKKQIFLLENILKKNINLFLVLLILCLGLSSNVIANEKWILDKNISSISFEVPVLFTTNVTGKFESIDGFVELDLKDKENNKAILSVDIESLKVNYEKYLDLILGPVFFDSTQYPLGVLDTNKFSYNNEEELSLNIELSIKGITKKIDTELTIINLTSDLVQIKGRLEFSRNDFNIGTGNWKNTTILKDNIIIKSNLFLMRD
ncbi:YceI family protein [Pelagibacteraceae bacterium]|nr:YceI family protein [Pelagibacteraceae bacterium]